MLEDLNTAFQSAVEFTTEKFVPGILAFEMEYIAIALAVFGVLLIFLLLLFKGGRRFVGIISRLILLVIIVASAYLFITNFSDKLSLEAIQVASPQTIIIGVLGGIVLIVALVIAVLSLKRHAKKEVREPGALEVREPGALEVREPSAPPIEPTTVMQPQMLTTQALKSQITNDRSLLAVISYVIIAEFGIFSTKTFPAPNPTVGMMFFAVFFVGAFIFIKTSYKSYVKGIAHLLVATIFAICLSVFLGHFWAEIPLATLLSVGYFGTIALVAVITGIAVSLLMGSRG